MKQVSLRELVLDRNRACILLFEFLWGVAIPFVYHQTVVPGFLQSLGVAATWVGLGPAMHNGLLAVVQPISAYRFRPGVRRARALRIVYSFVGLAYLGLGGIVWTQRPEPGVAFALTMGALALAATATGVGDPCYQNLVVESIPDGTRGRFFAMRLAFVGLGGLIGGQFAEAALRGSRDQAGYAMSFMLGGVLILTSTFSLAPFLDGEVEERPRAVSFLEHLSGRVGPLLKDRAFRGFLISVLLFALSVTVFPFLALLVRSRLNEGPGILGVLGGLAMGANLVMSGVLGVVSDRRGPRAAFGLGLLCVGLGVLGCLVATERAALYLCYFFAACFMPAQMVGATNLALRLAERVPGNISPAETTSVMMAISTPVRILGPILSGAILQAAPGPTVYILSITLAGCSVAALFLARTGPER